MSEWLDYNLYKDCPTNPPNDVLVDVLCDDYMGEYTMKAKRLDYKPGHQGKKIWRWVSENGVPLDRKESPNKWRQSE